MNSRNEIAIKISHVSKSFKLPHEKNTSVKSFVVNPFKKRTYEKQEVLKDIDFEIKKGDFFGIVGRNGSGKSTLLKLLAGIYSPDSGHIQVNGKLTPFIELGVGFNPELTGRENVFLNGALLGFNRKEMLAMYDEIVEFAEIEKFMDQKLKNYSSGMQVRLAFSIAIRAESDILVLDEVLAVGDANFQKKCYDVFKRYKTQGKTVVLVTHDMGAVEQFCNKAVLIDEGQIKVSGLPYNVTKSYNKANIEEQDKVQDDKIRKRNNKKVFIEKVWIEKNGKETVALSNENPIDIKIKVIANVDIKHPVFGITILDQTGRPLFATNTLVKEIHHKLIKDKFYTINFHIKNTLSDGNYYVVPAVTDEISEEKYDSIDEGHLFSISGWEFPAFVLQPDYSITIK